MAVKAEITCVPTLPQNDGILQRGERKLQLDLTRAVYAYNTQSVLPMPMLARNAALLEAAEIVGWVEGWLENQAKTFADLELWKFETRGQAGFSTLADYAKVFTLYPAPEAVDTWRDDRVFASQRVAGLNPMAITRVTADGSVGSGWSALSAKLSPKIDDAVFQSFPGLKLTLRQCIEQKRLYVTDFASLDGAIPKAQYQMAPIALFVRTDDFPGLQIAAIQLTQKPDDPFVYIAPHGGQPDADYRWLMAKMFLQCADLNENQAVNHLATTHLIEEAFAAATHRRLALQHPLYRLLVNHFTAVIVINQIGMLTLINPGGFVDQILDVRLSGALQLIKNAYQNWSFDQMDFPAAMKKRGVDDQASLPYYPYRDDGLLIWNRLGQYVGEYLALYYRNDSDVVADYELQDWAQQLSGVLDGGAGKVPGFPQQIETRDQLTVIVQRIIWAAGPQHAAVNFPQTDFTTFIPNAPGALGNPLSGTVTETDLIGILPDKDTTGVQVRLSYTLAAYHYDQLLDYKLCDQDGSENVVRKYHDLLTTTDRAEIVNRNKQRAAKAGLLTYPYFLPENIPNSTSV